MADDQSPKMLELEFEDELTPVMRLMLLDYMKLISSLVIGVMGNNQELLLRQSTFFESLESLRLDCPDHQNEENTVDVCEAMLAKHAYNLKYFDVFGLRKNLRKKLNVPALPVIDSLVLLIVEDEEAACSLYEQSRNTITSFTIIDTDIKLSKSAAFQGKCLFPFLTLILLLLIHILQTNIVVYFSFCAQTGVSKKFDILMK